MERPAAARAAASKRLTGWAAPVAGAGAAGAVAWVGGDVGGTCCCGGCVRGAAVEGETGA